MTRQKSLISKGFGTGTPSSALSHCLRMDLRLTINPLEKNLPRRDERRWARTDPPAFGPVRSSPRSPECSPVTSRKPEVRLGGPRRRETVSYTHLRAHETRH